MRQNNKYTYNKLDDLMIRCRDKIRSNIYTSCVMHSRTNGGYIIRGYIVGGREFHRRGQQF